MLKDVEQGDQEKLKEHAKVLYKEFNIPEIIFTEYIGGLAVLQF
jgi:hypothetical protein